MLRATRNASVTGEGDRTVIALKPIAGLDRIEVFSKWLGFAHPSSRADKLTVRHAGDRFVRELPSEGFTDEVPAGVIEELLAALFNPAVPTLDPTLFDVPARAIQSHYASDWTDDYPEILVRLTFSGAGIVEIRTTAPQAFMLPFEVSDSGGGRIETFDPRLSRAIARLLPDEFLERDRLAGQSGMLQWAIDEQSAVAGEA
ncbi:MAG: hypothetical protein M3478_14295, partial [Planctomycetota bacterium]|nr:hypothetical protein [Planctomycetota bacterium]